MTLLQESIINLLAAIISVPISKRLGFGSVLGCLCAGILIGPFVCLLNERIGSNLTRLASPDFDEIPEENNEVIIAGFRRVDQIVGRLLRSIDKPFTAVEIDSSQVDIVRHYGIAVRFGDASRPEVLRAASAKILSSLRWTWRPCVTLPGPQTVSSRT